ncbi:MAG: TIGR03085 family metal-binding protein [Nocardioides sp.]
MTSMARRERGALCDTALVLGEDAPTLCEGWDARLLVAHLLVRERNPLAMPGIAIPRFSGVTERQMTRTARTDFAVLVERLRSPSLPLAVLDGLDRLVNTMELFIHHEDLRRAQPGWTPRELSEDDQSRLWANLKVVGKGLVRPAGVPVTLRWGSRTTTLRAGSDGVEVSGLPSETAVMLHGRSEFTEVTFEGPEAAVAKLRRSDLGI